MGATPHDLTSVSLQQYHQCMPRKSIIILFLILFWSGCFDIQESDTPNSDALNIEAYSINLAWINRTLDPQQPYLYPGKDQRILIDMLLSPVMKWAEANPDADVNLWYDSEQSTYHAVRNTRAVLEQQLGERNLRNVFLKDVREIAIVKDNPDTFSDQIPVYFRIDLLKAIVIVHSIEHDKRDAAIFSDLEVGDLRKDHDRMAKDELFNSPSMKALKESGLIMNRGVTTFVENQFLQLINSPQMLSSIKHSVVNAGLMRIEFALNHSSDEKKILLLVNLGESVFKSLSGDAFKYFCLLESGGSIKVRPDVLGLGEKTDPWLDYTPEKHGYTPFGNMVAYNDFRGVILKTDDLQQSEPRYEFFEYFLKKDLCRIQSRNVDVRRGNSHATYPRDLVYRPPAASGSVYHVSYWK